MDASAADQAAELTLFRDTVRRFFAAEVVPHIAEWRRAGMVAREAWRRAGAAGLLCASMPAEFGGGGGDFRHEAILIEELAAIGFGDFAISLHNAIIAPYFLHYGTSEQKRRWLPRMASGEMIAAIAMTEPDAGSNSHRISTAAAHEGRRWVLRGTKHYISGVDEADAVIVVSRTGTEDATRRARLSLFIVGTDAKGFEARKIPVEIAAPEKQFTIFLDDCTLGEDDLLGTEGEGLRQVFAGLNPERLMGAAISCGIGRYALEKASAYATHRTVWDRPIGAHQGIAHPLAIAKIELELARLMLSKAAWRYDVGLEAGEAANMAKYAAAEASLRALDQAIQTHGGNGLASEFGLADLWGTARLLRTAPVSREMILNYVAQHSLGLPKSY